MRRIMATTTFVIFGLFQNLYAGFASVSQGDSIEPNPVILGNGYHVAAWLKETTGSSSISFDSIAIAILKPDNSILYNMAIFKNVTLSAGQNYPLNGWGTFYASNPAGTYKVMVRGKQLNQAWFDFSVTGSGVNPISFQANAAAPTLVSPANNSTVSGPPFSFTWNSVAQAGAYQLKLSSDPTFTTTIINDNAISGSATSYTYNSSLTSGTKYYWQMRILDGSSAQWGAWSVVDSFTAANTSTLPPPALSSPANNATVSGPPFIFTWNSVSGATAYQLKLSSDPTFTTTVINEQGISGSDTSFSSNASLTSGTKYYWQMRTLNQAGIQWGTWSVVDSFLASTTAAQWIQRNSGIAKSGFYKISWGNNLFVAVGDYDSSSYQRPLILTSPDGITWTNRTPATTTQAYTSVAWLNNQFLAGGMTTGIISTSSDGISWTNHPSGASFPGPIGSFIWEKNQFYAVGSFTSPPFNGILVTSPDGISWTDHSPSNPGVVRFAGIAGGNNRIIIVGTGVLTSPDGVAWTKQTADTLYDVIWGNNQFVAVGPKGKIRASADGVTWTNLPSGTSRSLYRITYSNNQLIAVGDSGTIISSPDGTSWTGQVSGTLNALNSITYGNGTFIASGSNGIILTKQIGATLPPPTQITPVNNQTVIVSSLPGTVPLSWSAVSGATNGYELQVDQLPVSPMSGTNYDASMSSGLHKWKIRSVNAVGSGAWSPEWWFNVQLQTTQTPLLISPAYNESDTDSVNFSWSCGVVPDSFGLYIDDDPNFSSKEFAKANILNVNGLSPQRYTLRAARGWLAEKKYYWKIKSFTSGVACSSAIGTFSFATNKSPQPVWGPVFRAYNAGDKDHFYCTQQQQESGALLRGYRPEKPQGFVSVVPFNDPDMTPVYRLYTGSLTARTAQCHFYTVNDAERDSCIRRGWTYEGIIGFAYKTFRPGLVAMRHLYLYQVQTDTIVRDHFYTVNEYERMNAINRYGFKDWGILAYVALTTDSVPQTTSLSCPMVGSGVDPLFGSLSHWENPGFSIPEGRMSLDFSHRYNSLSILLKTPIRSMGHGWSHTYSACLTTNDGSIKIFWPGGGYNEYDPSTSARKTKGIYDSLTKVSDTVFEIRTKNQIVYRFSMLHRADSLALLKSIKDRNNNTEQCTYDTGTGNLLSVTGPTGRSLTFGYSTGQDTFLIKNVRDPLNRSVGFLYDTLGQLIAYVNANGDTTRYKYDTDSPFEHLLDTIIKPEKNVFINVYETSPSAKCLHRIAAQKVITPGSPMQTITLDYSNSSFVKVTDPRGNDYDYFYGPQKEGLISSLLSSSGRDSFEYNDKRCNPGLPTKIIDGKGFATFVSYDSLGNVNSINKPHGIWHQFTYTPFNDLSRYIGPRNDTTIYGYDARGNLSMMRTYRGQTNIRYTSDGLMDSLSLPFSYPIKFTYNNYRELARIDYFNTTTWRQFSYDAVSRVTSTLSPKGQTTQRNYSNTDLVTSVIGALNDTTTFKYDRNGRLTLVRDAAHDSTRLAYNAMDLLDSIKNPLGNSVTFSYFGTQLTKKTLPSGDTLGFAYDNAGRVRSLGGALNAVFTYDGNDNVKSMTEGAKQTTFEYDSINRLSGYTDYYSDRVRYAWDKAGNLDTLFYPDGNFVHYEYYPDNLLSRITDWLGNVTTYTYNSNGSINDMVYPNGVSCSYTYDYAGRLIRTSALKTGTDSIFSYHFDYDSLGNILQEIKSEPLAAPIPASENTTYSYFKGNQLMTAGAYSFSYDINGNSYGDSAIGISHNYGFDPANRLLTIDSMGVRKSVFEYDASGNRRAATRSGAKTRYVLDVSGSMSNVIMEKDNNGNPLYYYVYGLGLVYRIKAATNAVSCYHYDLRGSTVAMTDINKNITHKYSYKPFGELAAIVEPSNDPNVFRFVGKYGVMDEGNGIYFMRARYYDSKIGRFLSEDPVWHINLFTYSDNNPFTKIDPSGRKWSELFPTVIKTIASAAAKAAEGIFRGFSAHSSPSGSDGLGVMLDGTEVVGNAEGVLIKNKNQIRAMVKGDPELIYDLGGYNNAAEYFNKYTGLNGGKTRQANIKAFLKKEYPGYTD